MHALWASFGLHAVIFEDYVSNLLLTSQNLLALFD